jgi:hypothetical protein
MDKIYNHFIHTTPRPRSTNQIHHPSMFSQNNKQFFSTLDLHVSQNKEQKDLPNKPTKKHYL